MNYIGKYVEIAKNGVIKVLYQKIQNNCILVSANGYAWYIANGKKVY